MLETCEHGGGHIVGTGQRCFLAAASRQFDESLLAGKRLNEGEIAPVAGSVDGCGAQNEGVRAQAGDDVFGFDLGAFVLGGEAVEFRGATLFVQVLVAAAGIIDIGARQVDETRLGEGIENIAGAGDIDAVGFIPRQVSAAHSGGVDDSGDVIPGEAVVSGRADVPFDVLDGIIEWGRRSSAHRGVAGFAQCGDDGAPNASGSAGDKNGHTRRLARSGRFGGEVVSVA